LEKSLIAELKDRADRAFKEVVFPQKRQEPLTQRTLASHSALAMFAA
jgi:hypothetical protein